MDDPFLMSVLHGLADGDGQLESLASRQPAIVAEPGDRDALDQLHDEIGSAVIGGSGVEDLGDIGVVHQSEGLPLGPEPGQHLAAVHAGLDELQRDRPPHRLGLFGHEDGAHAPLADRLKELVRADAAARALDGRVPGDRLLLWPGRSGGVLDLDRNSSLWSPPGSPRT